MELTKKDKTIKYVVYCLLIVGAALLQNTSGLFLEIGRARCFLLIPVAVILGIDEDERTAALIGLLAGVLWDIHSTHAVGFNCIFLMLVCYISSALVSYIFRSTYRVSVISAAVATALYCIIYWLVFLVFRHTEGAGATMLYFYLPCFIYTGVISLIACAALTPIKNKLNRISPIVAR